MTSEDLLEWRRRYYKTDLAARQALGISNRGWYAWSKGTSPVPRYIALACSAIACNLGPWPIGPEAR